MDLLVYLARARQRVVSADELLREVWQGRVFDDGIVYRKVNQLRKALGDNPQQPRFIKTISKRGYRLIAEVTEEPAVDTSRADVQPTAGDTPPPALAIPATRSARRLIGITALGAMLAAGAAIGYVALSDRRPADLVIAVLPCENLSPDEDRAFFASGIQEALIDQLAALGFGVIGRAAVMSYTESAEPLTAVARALNADAVMECTVRYADDRVRIAVALLDGANGTTLWRRPYEGEFADYFAIESEIASSVASALGTTIADDRRTAADNVASRSARAIEFYFSARRYEELGVTSWPTAVAQYERAVAEDPGFARAFAQLSMARTGLFLSPFARTWTRLVWPPRRRLGSIPSCRTAASRCSLTLSIHASSLLPRLQRSSWRSSRTRKVCRSSSCFEG